MENVLFDAVSWVGLVICIGAFFIKDMFWLRCTTLAGCAMLLAYYLHISVAQGVVSNLMILAINGFYLLKTLQRKDAVGEEPAVEC